MRKGPVRRVGAAVNHRKVGYRHNALVVWNAGKYSVAEKARLFSSFDEVSHCYQRRTAEAWPYSLYTMIHGRSRKECLACVRRMAQESGITDHRVLFTVKEYKKTKINLAELRP
jgi:DNA-binding Lrp family transcriptional regulator